MQKIATLPEEIDPKAPLLRDIFFAFFKMGITAFGPAMMAETKKNIVKRKGWLKEEEFLNGLALAQFLPGATFVTLTVFIGYRLRRLAGAAASFIGFLLPPFGLMVLLSYLYFRYSGVPLVNVAFRGIQAIVVALVANATLELGKSVIKGWQVALMAVVSLAVTRFYPNIFFILFLAAGLGILFYRPWKGKKQNHPAHLDDSLASFPWRNVIIVLVLVMMLAGLSAFNPLLWQLEKVFFRIGFLVFGNGFTMLPLIQQEVVDVHRWLNLDQFFVGIALGQVTPGPIVITATFVGYKVAGFLGALAATAGIFAPCFILVILVMPVYRKFKENRWVKVIFSGILACFTGLMVSILVDMGRHSLIDPVTIVLALAALIALRFTRLDVLWVVLGGTGIYLFIEKI